MKKKNNKYKKDQINKKLDQLLYGNKIIIKNQEKAEELITNIREIDEYVIDTVDRHVYFNDKKKTYFKPNTENLIEELRKTDNKKVKGVYVLKSDNDKKTKIKQFLKKQLHPKQVLIKILILILINYCPYILDLIGFNVDTTMFGIILEVLFN